MTTLTFDQLIKINERTVELHGGNFVPPHNLLNEAPLRYLIETIDATVFGQEMYPAATDKAAVYLFNIIGNHVFSDGNKRTGLAAAIIFLELNGFKIDPTASSVDLAETLEMPDAHQQLLYQFTLAVASGQYDLDSVRAWFAEHVVELPA